MHGLTNRVREFVTYSFYWTTYKQFYSDRRQHTLELGRESMPILVNNSNVQSLLLRSYASDSFAFFLEAEGAMFDVINMVPTGVNLMHNYCITFFVYHGICDGEQETFFCWKHSIVTFYCSIFKYRIC